MCTWRIVLGQRRRHVSQPRNQRRARARPQIPRQGLADGGRGRGARRIVQGHAGVDVATRPGAEDGGAALRHNGIA